MLSGTFLPPTGGGAHDGTAACRYSSRDARTYGERPEPAPSGLRSWRRRAAAACGDSGGDLGGGGGDQRRHDRRPAALRPPRRRGRGGGDGPRAGRDDGHSRRARRPVPLVELRHPHPAVRRGHRGARRSTHDVRGGRLGAAFGHGQLPGPVLRTMGSPRQVFGKLPRAVQKFSTTSTMQILATGRTTATIRYRLHDGYPHSRLDCLYTQGLLSTVPAIFTLPPARIVHDECQSDGHDACLYSSSGRTAPGCRGGAPGHRPSTPSCSRCAASSRPCSPRPPTSWPATTWAPSSDAS